jgi:hypothetical protein
MIWCHKAFLKIWLRANTALLITMGQARVPWYRSMGGSLHTETPNAGKLAGDLFVYAAANTCHCEESLMLDHTCATTQARGRVAI